MMAKFAWFILPVICLLLAAYGWVNALDGWAWWLLGVVLLAASFSAKGGE